MIWLQGTRCLPNQFTGVESNPNVGCWNKSQHPILSYHEFSSAYNSDNWKSFLSWSYFVPSDFAPICNPLENPSAQSQCAHILDIVQRLFEMHIPGKCPDYSTSELSLGLPFLRISTMLLLCCVY